MFSAAYLQYCGRGPLRHEEQLLKAEFDRLGVPVILYTRKNIERRNLPLSRETFIAGDMPAMHGAMRQLGIDIPEPDDYPLSLRSFMHRRIWKSTLDTVEQGISMNMGAPVFAKPAERRKSLTGRVFPRMPIFPLWGASAAGRRFGAPRWFAGAPSSVCMLSMSGSSALTSTQAIPTFPSINA